MEKKFQVKKLLMGLLLSSRKGKDCIKGGGGERGCYIQLGSERGTEREISAVE